MIDLDTARAFLSHLGDSYTFQSFDDSPTKRKKLARVLHGALDEHAATLSELNEQGAGIFVTVNETDGKGRKAANVTALRALFADADSGEVTLPIPPSLTVNSARGPHPYWLLEPDERLDRFTEAQQQIATALGTDPTVKDLSRVMRLPGFLHRKGEPKLVTWEMGTGKRYTIGEVLAAFPSAPKPKSRRASHRYDATGDVLHRARKYLDKVTPAVEGAGGDAQTLNAACRIVRGFDLSDSDALRLLEEWNTRCSPPWSREELETKIANARKYGTEAIGGLLNVPPPVRERPMTTHRPTQEKPATLAERLLAVKQAGRDITFDRGSEVELAEDFLARLKSAGGEVISTEGMLHQYGEQTGAWEALPNDAVMGVIAGYDGASVESGHDAKTGEIHTKPIKLTARGIEGIYRNALRNYDSLRPGFFSFAAPGVLLENGFARVDANGAHVEAFSSEHRARYSLSFRYDDNADVKPWADFMRGLFRDDADADQKVHALQEFVGATLVGIAPQYARCAVLTGSGANGKSTFIEIVSKLFPPHLVTSVSPQQWAKDYYASRLRDSMLNACNEMPESDILSSEVFKSVVTGEPITARDPYKAPYQFKPRCGHLFACNTLPGTTDHTQGFWRRFLVVEFTRNFAAEPDVRTKSDVVREIVAQLPAVLLWALHGAARLIRNGSYTIPASHGEAVGQWRTETNSVAAWVAGDDYEPSLIDSDWVRAGRAYDDYAAWCKANGMMPVSSIKFTRRLLALGVHKKKRADANYFTLRKKVAG